MALPAYNRSIIIFIRQVKEGFVSLDPILGQIRSYPVAHGGITRQVSEPQILETPMNQISVNVPFDYDSFKNTDTDKFVDFLLSLSESLIGNMRTHFFQVISKTCDATGNSISAANRNFWDSYIEMLETMEMGFDEDGTLTSQFVGPPTPYNPTPDQVTKIEGILKRKREEFNAKKRIRRLS